MKQVSSILSVLILFGGCSSYYQITEEEKAQIVREPKESIEITLLDGKTIAARPYHYVQTDEPSDFLLGVGELWNVDRNTRTSFRGKIQPQRIDSVAPNGPGGWMYYDCWISDSTKVRFQKDDCIAVSREDGTGLIVRAEGYRATIPLGDIKSIGQKKISGVKTAFLVLGSLAAVSLIGIIMFLSSNPFR